MRRRGSSPFMQGLRASRLLDEAQLQEIEQSRGSASRDDRALAGQLVDRGWLTPFQAERILAGRTQGFFIGPYVVVDRIGAGGMGMVYKAVHRTMQRTVALKVLPRALRADPETQARFMREVRATARLNHPNIVMAHDVGEEGDVTYLAMEYVEGTGLQELIARQGRVAFGRAADIAYQVALALEHARQCGIVHRDIKPGNILITDRGTAKVLDMGLARMVQADTGRTDAGRLTLEGVTMGTPDYLAPEQAIDTHTADTRADIYSLGCTLYHMLTGQVPFPGDALTKKLIAHQSDPPTPVTDLAPDVPAELGAVVARMMAKRPEDRYQTPAEVAGALLPWVAPAGLTPGPTVTPVPVPSVSEDTASMAGVEPLGPGASVQPPTPTRRARVPAWAWGLGAGAVVVLIVAIAFWATYPRVVRDARDVQRPGPAPAQSLPRSAPSTRPSDSVRADREPHTGERGDRPAQGAGASLVQPPFPFTNSVGMKMVYVRPGTFLMGSPSTEKGRSIRGGSAEVPPHRVTVTKGFYVATCEVTNRQYRLFRPDHRSGEQQVEDGAGGIKRYGLGGQDQPVVMVSWYDAVEFCKWLSARERRVYRLPTEAEWEYACRAGTTTAFQWGNDPHAGKGWLNGLDLATKRITRSRGRAFGWEDPYVLSSPVGRYRPNACGIHDMHGNVWEWCHDWYAKEYEPRSPDTDPQGPTRGTCRVARGGSYANSWDACRSAKRDANRPTRVRRDLGFRLVHGARAPPVAPAQPPSEEAPARPEPAVATKPTRHAPPKETAPVRTVGFALQFNGKGAHVVVPKNPKLEPPHAVTVECWLKPQAVTHRHTDIIRNAGHLNDGYYLALQKFGDGRIQFLIVRDRSKHNVVARDPTPVTERIGGWHHVAGCYDAKTYVTTLFVDGRRVAQAKGRPAPFRHTHDLCIGGYGRSDSYQGLIDEVRISDIVRYKGSFKPADPLRPDRHTLLLLHFDEGKGDVVHDASGNRLDGEIHDAQWVRLGAPPPAAPPPKSPPRVRTHIWVRRVAFPLSEKRAKAAQSGWAERDGVPVRFRNSVRMDMVYVPPGSFVMGASPAHKRAPKAWLPRHRVTLTRGFHMSATEVTNSHYQRFLAETKFDVQLKHHKGFLAHLKDSNLSGPNQPVMYVSWVHAMAFCQWLSRKERKPYTLPSEAQWEYACRAGQTGLYHCGNDPGKAGAYAWIGDRKGATHSVGRKRPNAWGLHDMHGNVNEWCCDWYAPYSHAAQRDPTGPSFGTRRVVRGGASTNTTKLTLAWRSKGAMHSTYKLCGFRLICLQKAPTVPTRHGKQFVLGIDAYHGKVRPQKALERAASLGIRLRVLAKTLEDTDLAGLDGLYLSNSYARLDASPEEAGAVDQWTKDGGVLIVCPLTWVAVQCTKRKERETSANVLVRSAGILFTRHYFRNEREPAVTRVPKDWHAIGRHTMADHPITEGVETIVWGGTMGVTTIAKGHVLIWGERGRDGRTEKLPWMVLVPHGRGYILGFQHISPFTDESFTRGKPQAAFDNAKLWHNIIKWMKQVKRDPRRAAGAGSRR